jgi:hypothetical protein
MDCSLLQRRRAHLRAPVPDAAAGKFAASNQGQKVGDGEHAAVIAAQLRAQIPCSTDPERLEKLACEAEGKPCPGRLRARNRRCFLLPGLRRLPPWAGARPRAQRGDVDAMAD